MICSNCTQRREGVWRLGAGLCFLWSRMLPAIPTPTLMSPTTSLQWRMLCKRCLFKECSVFSIRGHFSSFIGVYYTLIDKFPHTPLTQTHAQAIIYVIRRQWWLGIGWEVGRSPHPGRVYMSGIGVKGYVGRGRNSGLACCPVIWCVASLYFFHKKRVWLRDYHCLCVCLTVCVCVGEWINMCVRKYVCVSVDGCAYACVWVGARVCLTLRETFSHEPKVKLSSKKTF